MSDSKQIPKGVEVARTLSIGSLFSGIGGLDLAVEAVTGGRIAWMCERDAYARSVLRRHWPDIPVYEDVKTLLDPPKVDVLCGGFPCQDISSAGNVGPTREGINGERSGLWAEFARLICNLRPRLVFLENVSAIRSRGLDTVLGDLARFGYDAEWSSFRASDVGAPHNRRRWFLVGWLADADRNRLRRQCAPRGVKRDTDGSSPTMGEKALLLRHKWPPRFNEREEWRARLMDGLCTPFFRREPDGSPDGLEPRVQLRVLGNAVCPQQAVVAYEKLMRRGKLL